MAEIILGKEMYETVTIKNYQGELLAKFSFNPSDTNIVKRYEDFIKGYDEIAPKIEKYENIGANEVEKAKLMLQEIDSVIYELMNTLLDGDYAKDIFGVMGPLSPTPHGYYVTFIIEHIAKLINNVTGANLKKMDAKVKKHTSKYHK